MVAVVVDDDAGRVVAAPAWDVTVRAPKAEEGNCQAKAVATTRRDPHGAAVVAAAVAV